VITSTGAPPTWRRVHRDPPFASGDRLRRIRWSSRGAAAPYVNEFAAQLTAEIVPVIDAITGLAAGDGDGRL
jgi:uncharacterized protein (DUF58 family)